MNSRKSPHDQQNICSSIYIFWGNVKIRNEITLDGSLFQLKQTLNPDHQLHRRFQTNQKFSKTL